MLESMNVAERTVAVPVTIPTHATGQPSHVVEADETDSNDPGDGVALKHGIYTSQEKLEDCKEQRNASHAPRVFGVHEDLLSEAHAVVCGHFSSSQLSEESERQWAVPDGRKDRSEEEACREFINRPVPIDNLVFGDWTDRI